MRDDGHDWDDRWIVRPTYDARYYRARAASMLKLASAEPHAGVRSALQAVAGECLRRGAELDEDCAGRIAPPADRPAGSLPASAVSDVPEIPGAGAASPGP
jgi:hypothetical protein